MSSRLLAKQSQEQAALRVAANRQQTLHEPQTVTVSNQPSPAERSLLEAGFLGLAVLNCVAGIVLLVIPLLISASTGSFDVSDYGLGLAGLFFAVVWLGLSWVARRARLAS